MSIFQHIMHNRERETGAAVRGGGGESEHKEETIWSTTARACFAFRKVREVLGKRRRSFWDFGMNVEQTGGYKQRANDAVFWWWSKFGGKTISQRRMPNNNLRKREICRRCSLDKYPVKYQWFFPIIKSVSVCGRVCERWSHTRRGVNDDKWVEALFWRRGPLEQEPGEFCFLGGLTAWTAAGTEDGREKRPSGKDVRSGRSRVRKKKEMENTKEGGMIGNKHSSAFCRPHICRGSGRRRPPSPTKCQLYPWAAANERELWVISEINDLVSAYNVPWGMGRGVCVFTHPLLLRQREKHQNPGGGNEWGVLGRRSRWVKHVVSSRAAAAPKLASARGKE